MAAGLCTIGEVHNQQVNESIHGTALDSRVQLNYLGLMANYTHAKPA